MQKLSFECLESREMKTIDTGWELAEIVVNHNTSTPVAIYDLGTDSLPSEGIRVVSDIALDRANHNETLVEDDLED